MCKPRAKALESDLILIVIQAEIFLIHSWLVLIAHEQTEQNLDQTSSRLACGESSIVIQARLIERRKLGILLSGF